MKRRNKKYFTLIELLFVIAILVILIGISWVAGTKVLRNQTEKKTKAEILLLNHAVKQYKDRFGELPATSSKQIDFAAYLSKVKPGSGWSGKRPMYIDFQKADFFVGPSSGNIDYTEVDKANPAAAVYALDPYENPYYINVDAATGKFFIYSYGLDGQDDGGQYSKDSSLGLDDISSDNL
ncbi:MAG: type II secretion system GspH family protein [Lentisphaeraceae bacterium]|nr:type II secretion system GspH family protein [Lentisphaeraceae bacterium]